MSVTLSPDNPLVGRAVELSALAARFDDAIKGRGGVVLLSGEPGIGKTRLTHVFSVEAEKREALVLWGRCFDGDWSPPFAPWSEAIGGFARAVTQEQFLKSTGIENPTVANPLATLVPEYLARAQGLPALAPLGVDEDRARLYDAVVRFFANLSVQQAVVVVLEDIHWADGASLDLLRHVAFNAGNLRLLLVVTFRDIELTPRQPLFSLLPLLRREAHTIPITLSGLTTEDVETMLAGASPTPWSSRLARAIQVETKGNPFFIEELLRHLVDEAQSTGGGEWTVSGDLAEIAIPEGVRQVVARRLSRLSEETQRLLTHTAVFTGGFDFVVLPALLDRPEEVLLDSIDEALAAKMLEPANSGPERYDFVHAIVRHALSDTWNPSRRVRLHRRAAEALVSAYAGRVREHAAELAVQYHRSASLPGSEDGIPYALSAADQAASVFARDRTVHFLRIARDLAAGSDATIRAGILCRLAIAEAEAVLGEDARSTADDALAALDESGALAATTADFLADLAKALKQNAYVDVRVWRPLLEQGLSLVNEEHGRPWAKLMLLIEPVTPVSRDVIRAGRWTGFDREAIEIARATGDEEDYARSYESFDPRTRAETDELVDKARSWTRPAAVMYGLTVAANDYHYRHGAYRDAAALWEELSLLGERYGAISWQAQATNQLTWLHIAAGRFNEARDTESQANALLNRLGPGRRSHVFSMEMATSFAVYLGGHWYEIANFWANFVNDPTLGPTDTGTLSGTFFGGLAAFAFAEAGDAVNAGRLLAPLVTTLGKLTATDTNHNGAVSWAGGAVWRLGLQEYAPAIRRFALDLINAGVGDYPQTSNELTLARMTALLGNRDEALGAFESARKTLELTGQRPLLGIATLDQATILARGGAANYGHVVELLDTATVLFEALGMDPWLERAQTAREDADVRLGGRLQLPAGLTEREADVLKLVARGYSDRQISDDLFISPRTVNAHLRNMLNKTSVSNRTELSIWAFEQGLVTREESR